MPTASARRVSAVVAVLATIGLCVTAACSAAAQSGSKQTGTLLVTLRYLGNTLPGDPGQSCPSGGCWISDVVTIKRVSSGAVVAHQRLAKHQTLRLRLPVGMYHASSVVRCVHPFDVLVIAGHTNRARLQCVNFGP